MILQDGSGYTGSQGFDTAEIQGYVTFNAATVSSGAASLEDSPDGGDGGSFLLGDGSTWVIAGPLTETGTLPNFGIHVDGASDLTVSGAVDLPNLGIEVDAGSSVNFNGAATATFSAINSTFISGDLTGGGDAYQNSTVTTGAVIGGVGLYSGSTWTAGALTDGGVTVNDTSSLTTSGIDDADSAVFMSGDGASILDTGDLTSGDITVTSATAGGAAAQLTVAGDLTTNAVAIGKVGIAGLAVVYGDMTIGSAAAGTPGLNDGGFVETKLAVDGDTYLATDVLSDLTLSVEGTLTTGNLSIGVNGTADLGNFGTITVDDVTLGVNAESSGTLDVYTPKPQHIGGDLVVGNSGLGTFDISSGGETDIAGKLVIGADGNPGVATASLVSIASNFVTTGGALHVMGSVTVGGAGSGNLQIAGTATQGGGGAILTDVSAVIGDAAGSDGAATVTGAGGIWMNSGSLVVGNDGLAMLAVSGGGAVQVVAGLSIGAGASIASSVRVNGAGSTITAASVGVGGSALVAGGSGDLIIGTDGSVSATEDAAIWNKGSVTLLGGTLDAETTTLTAQAQVSGNGMLTAGTNIADGGTITATGGDLTVDSASVNGGGTLAIAAGATLTLAATVADTLTVAFAAATGVLVLADPQTMRAEITGFVSGDTIDLLGTDADGAVPTDDGIAVTDGVTPVVDLVASGLADDAMFDVASDGQGGVLITFKGPDAGTPSPPSLPLVTTVPTTLAAAAGTTTALSGISVSDPNADPTTTLTVILTDSDGTLAATASGGGLVTAGANGLSLTISGTLIQVNADLATLTYDGLAQGADTITVNSADNLANADAHRIAVTVGAPTPTATASGSGNPLILPGHGGADTVVAASGSNTITSAANGAFVFLGSGANVVSSGGTDTVVGGSGSATVSANRSSDLVFSIGGPLQFIAGSGASTVVAGAVATTLFGGAGNTLAFTDGATSYTGAGGTDTLVGLAGRLVAQAGTGGGQFYGGSAGGNVITTGAGNVTAFGGGAGDVLTATGSATNLFAGGVGAETLSAAGSSGSNTFFAGYGPETLTGGSGNTALVAGAGADLLVGRSGLSLFLFISGRTIGAADTISGFNPAHDFVKLAGYASSEASVVQNAVTANGSTSIVLSDRTTITFAGVSQLAASSFV